MSTPYRSIKQMVIDQIKHMIDNRIQRRMRSDYDDYDENREYYNGASTSSACRRCRRSIGGTEMNIRKVWRSQWLALCEAILQGREFSRLQPVQGSLL